MNILVIGNGFDLAHGLPTKYTDFLEFCRMIKAVYNVGNNCCSLEKWDNLKIKVSSEKKKLEKLFITLCSCSILNQIKIEDCDIMEYVVTNTIYDEFYKMITDNIWCEYFLNNLLYQRENWIDFENEISEVIKRIDKELDKKDLNEEVGVLSDNRLQEIFKYIYRNIEKYIDKRLEIDYSKFISILENDLIRLIRALEIYLVEYVGKIEVKKLSPDIQNLKIDTLISFNYTKIYESLYDKIILNRIDYIHGQAKDSNSIEDNNMVLGIDEYLPKKKRNKQVEFIVFKKFYQRIHKQTGCEYKRWIDDIKESGKTIASKLREQYPSQIPFIKFTDKHYLYIFGHSLDVTDKEILKKLILKDNVYTTIYYLNKKVMGQQIANLVKVIGQDELIRRTGGNTKTIEFKLQQDMVER